MFPRQRPKINPPPFSPALSQTTCHTPLSPSFQEQLSPSISKSENNPGHCTRPSARPAPHQGPPLGDPGPCPLPAAGPGATSLPLHSPPPPSLTGLLPLCPLSHSSASLPGDNPFSPFALTYEPSLKLAQPVRSTAQVWGLA